MKKEKPLIQHPTDPLSTQSELPVPQPLFDDRSMNLSEKEIIDLFEKMMVSFGQVFSLFTLDTNILVNWNKKEIKFNNREIHLSIILKAARCSGFCKWVWLDHNLSLKNGFPQKKSILHFHKDF